MILLNVFLMFYTLHTFLASKNSYFPDARRALEFSTNITAEKIQIDDYLVFSLPVASNYSFIETNVSINVLFNGKYLDRKLFFFANQFRF